MKYSGRVDDQAADLEERPGGRRHVEPPRPRGPRHHLRGRGPPAADPGGAADLHVRPHLQDRGGVHLQDQGADAGPQDHGPRLLRRDHQARQPQGLPPDVSGQT